jgi:hypothetical protein
MRYVHPVLHIHRGVDDLYKCAGLPALAITVAVRPEALIKALSSPQLSPAVYHFLIPLVTPLSPRLDTGHKVRKSGHKTAASHRDLLTLRSSIGPAGPPPRVIGESPQQGGVGRGGALAGGRGQVGQELLGSAVLRQRLESAVSSRRVSTSAESWSAVKPAC